jgi:DNA helicase-2/ATP-dependent DNA helicase PcrA
VTDNIELIEKLWKDFKFTPNHAQRDAILYSGKKPLFITASPGSGKTRVLLWRTVYLIACKGVSPDNIFLSTFTEKAAHQLREGLKEYLGAAANHTGEKYDLARMYVGTIHSNCHRMLLDRNFSSDGSRMVMPTILDELAQYMHIYRKKFWKEMLQSVGWDDSMETNQQINQFLNDGMYKNSRSRHHAAVGLIKFFNRLSEELAEAPKLKSQDKFLNKLYRLYEAYTNSLRADRVPLTDLSLVQGEALRSVRSSPKGHKRFEHVIIDEYQDTNTVQEKLVFALAEGSKNLCVVGDDDQALYRFRGATVENFVEFPKRCKKYYEVAPEKVELHVNYRSLSHIVKVSQEFMGMFSWRAKGALYRIPKKVVAERKDTKPAVFLTDDAHPDHVAPQIAKFIKQLKQNKKINDYSEVAILFSYLRNNGNVERLAKALQEEGIEHYAPRAGRFLDQDEAIIVFGLFGAVLGLPGVQGQGRELADFRSWMDGCEDKARELMQIDGYLKDFIEEKRSEIETTKNDYAKLSAYFDSRKISFKQRMTAEEMQRAIRLPGLSSDAIRKLSSQRLIARIKRGDSKATVGYVINRVTSLDWGLLDLFYQLTRFSCLKTLIDAAAEGSDEGPICNLGLLTQYISRYQEEKGRPIITAGDLSDDMLQRHFFLTYLFAMYRLGETEFEDKEDPFPKGRVSFITIHQAKGLEFPVVILGSLFRRDTGPDIMEKIVREELGRKGEPLDRMTEFDNARLFYVALSRAKNVLVLPRYSGQGQRRLEAFKEICDSGIPTLDKINWDKIEAAKPANEDTIGKSYSYTSDYLMYKRCPRQYMLFRKYDFVPARGSVMLFGSLIHQTLEDLHNYLLAQKGTPA